MVRGDGASLFPLVSVSLNLYSRLTFGSNKKEAQNFQVSLINKKLCLVFYDATNRRNDFFIF